MFKQIVTSIIGTILLLCSTGLYFASFFMDVLSDVSWKHCLGPFILGTYLLLAKDDDILSPIKSIINILTNRMGNNNSQQTPAEPKV